MKFFACSKCRNAWLVGGDPKEVAHILSMVDCPPCITPLCLGRMDKVPGVPIGFRSHEIPVVNFYRAINGFGSPEGKAASVEEFTRLLKTRKIVEVRAEAAGQPERVILSRLVLDDGTRLHFDASTKGACCYYIEKRGPSCLEVVEDELHSEGAAESSAENREEAGRAAEGLCKLADRAREIAYSAPAFVQPHPVPLPALSKAGEVPTGRNESRGGDDEDMRVRTEGDGVASKTIGD